MLTTWSKNGIFAALKEINTYPAITNAAAVMFIVMSSDMLASLDFTSSLLLLQWVFHSCWNFRLRWILPLPVTLLLQWGLLTAAWPSMIVGFRLLKYHCCCRWVHNDVIGPSDFDGLHLIKTTATVKVFHDTTGPLDFMGRLFLRFCCQHYHLCCCRVLNGALV